MNIIFADRKLGKYANDTRLAQKKIGVRKAGLLHQRLEELYDTGSFADLHFLPGNYHQLTGNRNGQWSCNLDHPYRLIFKPGVEPIPTDEHGSYILAEIRCVEIIEIVDYH